MYFWKIDKLKCELVAGNITQRSTLKYLIASTLTYLIMSTPIIDAGSFGVIEHLISAVIFLVGILYVYFCNGGDSGSDFLLRFLTIGWVEMVRVFSLSAIFILALGVFLGYLNHFTPEENQLIFTFISLVILVFYYWRVSVHITHVAAERVGESK